MKWKNEKKNYEDIMNILIWRYYESEKPSASPDRLLLSDRPTLVFVDLFENPLDLFLAHLDFLFFDNLP